LSNVTTENIIILFYKHISGFAPPETKKNMGFDRDIILDGSKLSP